MKRSLFLLAICFIPFFCSCDNEQSIAKNAYQQIVEIIEYGTVKAGYASMITDSAAGYGQKFEIPGRSIITPGKTSITVFEEFKTGVYNKTSATETGDLSGFKVSGNVSSPTIDGLYQPHGSAGGDFTLGVNSHGEVYISMSIAKQTTPTSFYSVYVFDDEKYVKQVSQILLDAYTKAHGAKAKEELETIEQNAFKFTAIDLGLSVKWANANIGANAQEEFGDYFAWGETVTKNDFSWSNYQLCNGTYNSFTKYNDSSENGVIDNKNILDNNDDVAYVKLGNGWRMPTNTEWMELQDNCSLKWTAQNGVNGLLVTSKKNGASLFLPAAGIRYGTSLEDSGLKGCYWSSSLVLGRSDLALGLSFDMDGVDEYGDRNSRFAGLCIRPVLE